MALVFPDSLALKRHGAAGPEPSVRHADSESLGRLGHSYFDCAEEGFHEAEAR